MDHIRKPSRSDSMTFEPSSPQEYRHRGPLAAAHGAKPEKDQEEARGFASAVITGHGKEQLETFGPGHVSPNMDATLHPGNLAESPIVPSSGMHSPSDRDILYDIYRMLEEMMEDIDVSFCFERAAEVPPITLDSLSELDMARIINNPKLRHDVNFDRELHFRPNLDGSKGRQKLRMAEEYWKALEGELFMYSFLLQQRNLPEEECNYRYWERVMKCNQKRLPKVFETIREILKTLVPDHDQPRIEERLNVELIMQEIQNGMCDLMNLAQWFSLVLKAHCAPMRDALVDQMVALVTKGATTGSHEMIVAGLRQLLGILEAMKLDVANHQIRHMRALLIDDTLQFQQRYHQHRISIGRIDVPRAREWLEQEVEQLVADSEIDTQLNAFTSALLRAVVTHGGLASLPQTFYLDTDRLRILSGEIHSLVLFEVCGDVLAELAADKLDAKTCDKARDQLQQSLNAIVSVHGKFLPHVENIAVEIVRIMLNSEGCDSSYDPDLVSLAENRLRVDLQTTSEAFSRHCKDLLEKLLPQLQTSVRQHVKFSTMALHDTFLPAPATPYPTLGFGAVMEGLITKPKSNPIRDVIERFTHLAVLHWQIWSPIVYLASPTPEIDAHSSAESDGDTRSGGSVPVAQAVYAPGGKWLPIAVTVTETGLSTPPTTPSPEPERQQPSSDISDEPTDAAPIVNPQEPPAPQS